MSNLTAQEVRKLLSYDEVSGHLHWKRRQLVGDVSKVASWNTKNAGNRAFYTIGSHGYYQGSIFGKIYLAHRIVWLMQTGKWPHYIDHKNGDRTDNSWSNLRSTTIQENNRNLCVRRNSRSGTPGVYWHKAASKWAARINSSERTIHLGLFLDLSEAIAARKEAEVKYGYHPNHGRR